MIIKGLGRAWPLLFGKDYDMSDVKATPSEGAKAGPAAGGVGTGKSESNVKSLGVSTEPGFAGPKNPPPQPQPESAEAKAKRFSNVQKPETVIDKVTGRDITPGYAGPRNPASGAAPNNPPPDPPVHPDPVTPADPRPGDYKPGHSGNVPTPPYSAKDAEKVDEPNKKETK
jgi:hypothetical protein